MAQVPLRVAWTAAPAENQPGVKTDSTVPSDSPWRGLLGAVIVVVAVAWFVVGLSAPLTPSFGPMPKEAALVFALAPSVAMASTAQLFRLRSTRWFVRALSCLVCAVTFGLIVLLGMN